MKVNPKGLFLEITDKELFNYPFDYIVEPGRLTFTEHEIPILRQYLLNGGFLMFDDKKWSMAIIYHNTDLGDGWEREGEYEFYFKEFSEKKAYPMGINIVYYAMTH